MTDGDLSETHDPRIYVFKYAGATAATFPWKLNARERGRVGGWEGGDDE